MRRKISRALNNTRGAALAAVLVIMVTFIAFGFSLLFAATNFHSTTLETNMEQQAYLKAKTFMQLIDEQMSGELGGILYKEFDGRFNNDFWTGGSFNESWESSYDICADPNGFNNRWSKWTKVEDNREISIGSELDSIEGADGIEVWAKKICTGNDNNPSEYELVIEVKCKQGDQAYIVSNRYSCSGCITSKLHDPPAENPEQGQYYTYEWNGWKRIRN